MAISTLQLALTSYPEILRIGRLPHVERHRPTQECIGIPATYLTLAVPHLLGITSSYWCGDVGVPGNFITRQSGLYVPRRQFHAIPERKDGAEALLRQLVVATGSARIDDGSQAEWSLE